MAQTVGLEPTAYPPGAVLYQLSYVCVCALPASQQEPIRCIGAVSYGRGLY